MMTPREPEQKMVTIPQSEAVELLKALKLHEAARTEFTALEYTDDQWNAITSLILKVRKSG